MAQAHWTSIEQAKAYIAACEKSKVKGLKYCTAIDFLMNHDKIKCSRTGTIPVKENELGVALVSGFSPSIVKMVLSNSTDPFECLLEQLNSERYAPVEQAVKG